MHVRNGNQIVSSPHKVSNIMNGYFVNIASTIWVPVDEEILLLSDHNLCEWAIENHKTHQSIIAITSQFAPYPQFAYIHCFTLSNVSPSDMLKVRQNLNTKKSHRLWQITFQGNYISSPCHCNTFGIYS